MRNKKKSLKCEKKITKKSLKCEKKITKKSLKLPKNSQILTEHEF